MSIIRWRPTYTAASFVEGLAIGAALLAGKNVGDGTISWTWAIFIAILASFITDIIASIIRQAGDLKLQNKKGRVR
jgi:hypothetical protein